VDGDILKKGPKRAAQMALFNSLIKDDISLAKMVLDRVVDPFEVDKDVLYHCRSMEALQLIVGDKKIDISKECLGASEIRCSPK